MTNVSAEVEREIIKRVFGDIEKACGVRPTGWMGSGENESTRTSEFLEQEGILWNGDFPTDDVPYTVTINGRRIVIIPYSRESNDTGNYGGHRHHPRVWLEKFKDQFDVLYAEGEKYPQLVFGATHAWLLGHPVGKKVIREAIRYTKGFPAVWQTTENDIARWWLKQNYD
jgi:allantoinase